PRHAGGEDGEQRLAHPVRRGPRGGAGRRRQPPPAPFPGDHAHARPRYGPPLHPRLPEAPVSTLCDADKSLPVLDPAIRPLRAARLAGPAFTVVAAGGVLSV